MASKKAEKPIPKADKAKPAKPSPTKLPKSHVEAKPSNPEPKHSHPSPAKLKPEPLHSLPHLEGQKKILVTAALPYVNNVPHLGTIVPILSADAYARFLRLTGQETLFVCGTDEHGTTTETKALEEGLTPRQVCDKYFALQKDVYHWFECSFDAFGRTSSQANREITLDIFDKLDKNGFILEQGMDQAFCPACKRFLADRFVGGTCPHCKYPEARGDQCENCGKLLDPAELIKPLCRVCKKTAPEIKQTNHLFIDLPKLEKPLKEWMAKVKPRWSQNAITMTDAWLKEGLKPRCISRDLKWGIPVPRKGFEDKVFYSWFDAPIGYIGITAECNKPWLEWWQHPKDVRLVQFMGKDNIPFHSILFPAFLIGTKDPWTLVSDLSVNEYLNLEGGLQFSKSRGVGVFGDDAKNSGIQADIWRYYILVNRPEKADTEFSWHDLQSKINDELVANFGNLVNRTITFMHKFYGNVVDKIKLEEEDEKFIEQLEALEGQVKKSMQELKIKDALKEVMHISKLANQYFQKEEPWKKMKEHPIRASTAMGVLVNIVKDLSILMSPFMPHSCARIQHQLNVCDMDSGHHLCWDDLGLKTLAEGHRLNDPELLFRKVEDAEIKALSERFGMGKAEFAPNLRVAKIMKVEPHPNADKLYVLQLDLGGLGPRQIVAGIRNYYTPDELLNKKIVIVSNLQPAMLRGVESKGMLLAGEKDGKVRVVQAPKSNPGDQANFGTPAKEAQIDYDEFSKFPLEVMGGKLVQVGKSTPLKTQSEEVVCDVGDHAKVK